ncbi:hypothetical protein A0H81_00101 [Grifola frondosa]|uniref:Uncharacterized protein n=1 Tax=Grifola frondosa TaxID=5627 RepID=A0A1C7MTP6_GRIFR|nr:hypothetical protein A0H81_00101 [Grifola frondosa]
MSTLDAEQGKLMDPNRPPSRPSSALSAASTESFTTYSDEEDEDEQWNPQYLHPRQLRSALRRDNGCCILCGKEHSLRVFRLVGQYDDNKNTNIMWLQRFALIPAHYDRDNLANLMTLCEPHAAAYRARVFRLLPCATFRKGMLTYTPPPYGAVQHEENQTSSTQEPIFQTDSELPLFDILIFLPDLMPPISPPESVLSGKQSEIPSSEASPRVLPSLLRLRIDPYIAYTATLEAVGKPYWPPPDGVLGAIEAECLEIRRKWNHSVAGRVQQLPSWCR